MTKGAFRPWMFAVIVAMHVVAIVATPVYAWFYDFSLEAWAWFLALLVVRSIGISLGNHRLFTHRSFSCHFATKMVLQFFASTAFQGSFSKWGPDHRQHHWDTEGPWDPHSPTRYPGLKGLLWAHVGWLFYDVVRPPELRDRHIRLTPTAIEDRRLAKWERFVYPLGGLCGFILPLYFAGVGGLLLAGFVGVVFFWNYTWSVNSIGHKYGHTDERFRKTDDHSRNVWSVNLLTLIGEHLHFFHHQKQDSAFFGWKWYHPDLGKWILILFEKNGWFMRWIKKDFGLFWDIKRPPVLAIVA